MIFFTVAYSLNYECVYTIGNILDKLTSSMVGQSYCVCKRNVYSNFCNTSYMSRQNINTAYLHIHLPLITYYCNK